jgi:hypothetical protein
LKSLIIQPVQEVYKPIFDVSESRLVAIADKKIGQRIKVYVNFEVIEKTKNYTIVRVNGMSMVTTKRTF